MERSAVIRNLVLLVAGACALAPEASFAASEGDAFFESKIRPVLIESCYSCHSVGKDAKIKGELRVDTRDGLLKGGSTGEPAVVPGNVDKGLLIKAIRYTDPDMLMPPKKRLPPEVVKDFETWVKMGAPDPRTEKPAAATASAGHYVAPAPDSSEAKAHWAFKPVTNPAVPSVTNTGWAKGDIDRFILARQEAKGVKPPAAADKQTLIRRATFDLTGLPPTPAEVDAFLADDSADAFAKLIDRLLASPAYGERWGRHWLDVARYADTGGESSDYPIPQAVKYRDYVIAAFNADKPYDQFLREQVSGDLLPYNTEAERREQIIATGFLAIARRFSVQPENVMHLTIEDAMDTMGRSVLGLSLSCARCHDHKFDPIPTADYYALYGIFNSTRFPFPGSENTRFQKDLVPLISDEEADKVLGPHNKAIAAAEAEFRQAKRLRQEAPDQKTQIDLRARERAAQKKSQELAATMPDVDSAYAVIDSDEIGDSAIHKRGEPGEKGPVVRRGFISVLGGKPLPRSFSGSGRRELGQWLADPANPLTARVMVNRIWQHHFGRGLVHTSSDFGFRGTPPTHPELLDHLASRFIAEKWSIKAMHRLIMNSAAYRMSSQDHGGNAALDPANDLLWRFERRRLDAESIRDAMLAVSGKLDASPGGVHPFPPKTKWNWTQHAPFTAVYETNKRSVYVMVQRIRRHPYLATFDGPDPNASTADRAVSTTPLQALFMMNDPFVHESADGLAARAEAAAPDETGRVERMYRLAFGRAALPNEVAEASSYVRVFAEKLKADGVAKTDADAAKAALASLARVLMSSNEFVYVE